MSFENTVWHAGARTLTDGWWTLVVRGIAAMLFGALAIVAPGPSLLAMVLMWGAYACVDGVFSIALAVERGRAGLRWGWWVASGLVSLAAGILTFFWPGMTGMVLYTVIAMWAIARGGAEIVGAIGLRQVLRGDAWLLGFSGALSIVFGAVLLASPLSGAVAVSWVVGGYAILFGGILVRLGLRLHSWRRDHVGGFTPGGTPTAA